MISSMVHLRSFGWLVAGFCLSLAFMVGSYFHRGWFNRHSMFIHPGSSNKPFASTAFIAGSVIVS